MKTTKWIVAALAACAVSLLAGCSSETDEPDPGIVYDTADWIIDGGTVIQYRGTATTATIPDGVTRIAKGAFSGRAGLASVAIPDGVTIIEASAFSGCASLTGVTIPDSVVIIGESAFYECASLKSVTLGNGVVKILGDAFNGCASLKDVQYTGTLAEWCAMDGVYNLMPYAKNVTVDGTDLKTMSALVIPDGVERIGENAFRGCKNLESVTIPGSVTSIGYEAFDDCNSLEKVTYKGTLAQWCGIDWGSSDANPLSNSKAVLYFGDEELTVADIPEGVTEIKPYAFSGCSGLTSVTIPEGVTSIGSRAFINCHGLKKVTYQGTLEQWCNIDWEDVDATPLSNSNAVLYFGDKELTAADIPAGVTEIKPYAFNRYTSLKSVTIPDSVTSIGDGAFDECRSLASVTIPGSVTSIGSYAFSGCWNLTKVTLPASVTSIGYSAFWGCTSIEKVTYSGTLAQWCTVDNDFCLSVNAQSVILTGENSLDLKKATTLVIPESADSIGSGAFSGCNSLTEVKIPASVTAIGKNAFWGCSSLNTVQYDGTKEEWEKVDRYKDSWRYQDGLSGKTITGKDADGNEITWTAQ